MYVGLLTFHMHANGSDRDVMSEFETVFGLRRDGLVRDFESLCVVTLGLVQGCDGDGSSLSDTK